MIFPRIKPMRVNSIRRLPSKLIPSEASAKARMHTNQRPLLNACAREWSQLQNADMDPGSSRIMRGSIFWTALKTFAPIGVIRGQLF